MVFAMFIGHTYRFEASLLKSVLPNLTFVVHTSHLAAYGQISRSGNFLWTTTIVTELITLLLAHVCRLIMQKDLLVTFAQLCSKGGHMLH